MRSTMCSRVLAGMIFAVHTMKNSGRDTAARKISPRVEYSSSAECGWRSSSSSSSWIGSYNNSDFGSCKSRMISRSSSSNSSSNCMHCLSQAPCCPPPTPSTCRPHRALHAVAQLYTALEYPQREHHRPLPLPSSYLSDVTPPNNNHSTTAKPQELPPLL
jgi:hypothetical protein